MKRYAVPILIALVAAMGIGIVVQAAYLSRLERKIDRIERDLKSVEARKEPAPREVARKDNPVFSFDGKRREKEPVLSDPADGTSPDPDPNIPPDLRELIRATARREVQEEMERRQKQRERDRKPPLDDVARKLQLDPSTQQQMQQLLEVGKDDVLLLLKAPRADGGNFVDEFVVALKSENRDAEAGKVWQRLMSQSDKVPGTEHSYIQRYEVLQKSVNESLKTLLNDEQWKSYQEMELNPLDIETGHSPWQDYFRSQGTEWPEGW